MGKKCNSLFQVFLKNKSIKLALKSPPALFISLSIKGKSWSLSPNTLKRTASPLYLLTFPLPQNTSCLLSMLLYRKSSISFLIQSVSVFYFPFFRTTLFQIGAWFVTSSRSSLYLNIIFLLQLPLPPKFKMSTNFLSTLHSPFT